MVVVDFPAALRRGLFNVNFDKNHSKIDRSNCSIYVFMCLANNIGKILKDVFDTFSTEVSGNFDKTIVPVRLVNSSDLVSRSQVRRILIGLELFREVILDFRDIEYIG